MSLPPPEIISRAILTDVLENPLDYPWRSHGIGMLRTYLDSEKNWRLNLWHPRLLNVGISTMHTHPWAFRSFVLAGELRNTRWIRSGNGPRASCFNQAAIPCGDHAPQQHDDGPLFEGEPVAVYLSPMTPEVYGPTAQYQQDPLEIHTTEADPGTVTIMHRNHYQPDGRAFVFWPCGQEWGDASRATSEEDILETCAAALAQFNKTTWSNT